MNEARLLYERNNWKFIHATIIACLFFCTMQLFAQPLASGKDKFLGCGSSSYIWRYLDQYWNQVTPGNDGKWGSVENVRGQYNWTDLDKIYNFAVNRNLLFKEHVFIWSQQQPGWIASLDTSSQRIAVEDWIKNFAAHYPLMSFVDVVNEPFHGAPSYKNALGGNGATGWDWIITAFKLARKYCPAGTKLILNEYNVLHDNTVTTNYINIINLLKSRDLIDGIGVQGHYFEFRSHTDATSNNYVYSIATIKANLDRLAATGLPIYMTEFDIDESNDASQLAQYKIYFPIFWNHPAVKGITLWGYISDDVWTSHPYTYLLLANGTERPALTWLREYINDPTNVKNENETVPTEISLKQNYPNPFNPETIISYQLPNANHVSLKVYDLMGREVETLVDEYQQAGRHNSHFSIRNSKFSSGVYFYTLSAGDFIQTRKMILIK